MSRPTVFGQPKKPNPIEFRSNVGTKIPFVVAQDGVPFNFSGWTGRCGISDLKGNTVGTPPVVTLDNTNPLKAVAYVMITREIANALKGKLGIQYDLEIDSGVSSYCLSYGGVSVTTGAAPIP